MNTQYNPYSPPTSEVAERAGSQDFELAGKGRRFGTLVIDYIVFYIVMFMVGMVVGVSMGAQGVHKVTPWQWQLLALAVLLGYYLFFEGLWQRTPGKFLLGTVVVSERGDRPSFKQILGRTLCRMIPFEAFSFFGQEGWHDSIPRTKVVMLRAR